MPAENALLKLQVAQARMAEDAATAKLLTRPEAMQTAMVVADVPGIKRWPVRASRSL